MEMKNLLNQLLNESISLESFKNWICSQQDGLGELSELKFEPSDFSFFLLSYLREQTISGIGLNSTKLQESDQKVNNVVEIKKQTRNIQEKKSPKAGHNFKRTSPNNFTLGNFIVTTSTSKQKRQNKSQISPNSNLNHENNTPKRRINPTKVGVSKSEMFGSPILRSSNVSNPFIEAKEESPSCDREMLKRGSLKISNNLNSEMPNISNLSITPKLSNTRQLDLLSDIYNLILDFNLALNIMNELYFLIELLTTENMTPQDENKLFISSQDCVYFATKTLFKQRNLLQFIDSTSIRFLFENKWIKEYSPELVTFLKKLKSSFNRSVSMSSTIYVPYQSDSFDKLNFSSLPNFQIFRKHRDTFYFILEKWDIERSLTPQLILNIQSIFKQNLKPEFYYHFCELFVSQIIASCLGEGTNLTEKNSSSNIPELRVDPLRLRKLHERLVTPVKSTGGPCPMPEFLGWEVFFVDFIKVASSFQFICHLKDCLMARIIELNSQNFPFLDLTEPDTSIEEESRGKFVACTLSLQLLGKFLGYLSFAPYRTEHHISLPDHVIQMQATPRQKFQPELDCNEMLLHAEKHGRLVVTVPWLASYMSQLDQSSLRLSYYTRTLQQFLRLQRSLYLKTGMPVSTCFLLQLCIGWTLTTSTQANPRLWDVFRNSTKMSESGDVVPGSLDTLDLLDSGGILAICPFLCEIRVRLAAAGVVESRNVGTCSVTRHITPVTASNLDTKQQCELQLEASFLRVQAGSVRRTLEFVVERVSSTCTKHLQADVLSQHSHTLQAQVGAVVKSKISTVNLDQELATFVEAFKDSLSSWSQETAVEQCKELLQTCSTEAHKFCWLHCSSALSHLLPPASSDVVAQALATIAARQATVKVQEWINTRVSVAELRKQILDEVDREAKLIAKSTNVTNRHDPRFSNTLPPGGRSVTHNDQTVSPAQVLTTLRELILQLLLGTEVHSTDVETLLTNIPHVIESRADMIPSAHTSLQELTLDLAVGIICRQPNLLTNNVKSKLIAMWQGVVGRPVSLNRLLCARNLKQMSAASRQSWTSLRVFMVALAKAKLLSASSIEEQAVAVLQQEWPQSFMSNYTTCIEDLVKEVTPGLSPSEAASFSQLLEWLAMFCRDLDFDLEFPPF